MRAPSVICTCLAISISTPVAAQHIDSLPIGARVRVVRVAPVYTAVTGSVVSRDSVGALVLNNEADGFEVRIERNEIRRVLLAGDRRTAGQAFGRGALRGALAGGAVAAVLLTAGVLSDARRPCSDCWISNTAGAAIVSVPIIVVTPLIGGLVGLGFRDRWHEVDVRR